MLRNISRTCSDTLTDKPNKTIKMLLSTENLKDEEKKHNNFIHKSVKRIESKRKKIREEKADSFSKYTLGK